MSGEEAEPRVLLSVVLGDANVLYPRVLRDYILYAMARQLIGVRWSKEILDEVVEHLMENIEGFDNAAGERLVTAMNRTFPYSQVELTDEATAAVGRFTLTDEDDRHVIAAAVAADATFLCSDDRVGFPPEVMATLGIETITSDALLRNPGRGGTGGDDQVHRTATSRLPGATDESTIAALRGAKAYRTAELMEELLRM
ncbi:MAG: PIN domain-containing protein [Actinomycetes bacterium]